MASLDVSNGPTAVVLDDVVVLAAGMPRRCAACMVTMSAISIR
jgi:hypothetical protein